MRFGLLVLNLRFFPVAAVSYAGPDLSAFGPDYHVKGDQHVLCPEPTGTQQQLRVRMDLRKRDAQWLDRAAAATEICASGQCRSCRSLQCGKRHPAPLVRLVSPRHGQKVTHQSVLEPVHPAVHGQRLTAVPCVADDRRLADVGDLLDHVELAQAVDASSRIGPNAAIRASCLCATSCTWRSQLSARPTRRCLERRTARRCSRSGRTTMMCSTLSTSTANCITDRQLRSLCTTTLATLRWTKSSPGKQADDLVGRHAAVRAADPQVVRRLLVREVREEIGIAAAHALRPRAVVVE